MSTPHHNSEQEKSIKQLEAELEIAQQQLALAKQELVAQQQRLEAKRQEFIHEHGAELLALIEGDPRAKVFITPVVEKLVLKDLSGNIISKTDGIVIGNARRGAVH
jgi:multidrug efflux pump subunit AcrA (membrane-fusion protein)